MCQVFLILERLYAVTNEKSNTWQLKKNVLHEPNLSQVFVHTDFWFISHDSLGKLRIQSKPQETHH